MENAATLEKTEAKMVTFDFYKTTNLISSLIEVFSFELELLAQMKIQDLKPMQAKKSQLTLELEAQLTAFRSNHAVKASMTAARASELKELMAKYEEVMAAYHYELFKAQKVNEETIKIIVDVVKEHAQRSNGYGKTGTRRGVAEFNNTSYASATPALKFNEQI